MQECIKNAAEMRTHQRCLNFNLKEDPVQEYIYIL